MIHKELDFIEVIKKYYNLNNCKEKNQNKCKNMENLACGVKEIASICHLKNENIE
jgi:hypothetical protein